MPDEPKVTLKFIDYAKESLGSVPVCPHCGEVNSANDVLARGIGERVNVLCESCGEVFSCEMKVSVEFINRKELANDRDTDDAL